MTKGFEYKEVIKKNGEVIYRIPVLSDEEREERHQRFLSVANKLLEKYKSNSSYTEIG